MNTTPTIEQLEATPIAGNAYSDSQLMRDAHLLIMSADTDMSIKQRALRVIDNAMGFDDGAYDEAAVASYIAECTELSPANN